LAELLDQLVDVDCRHVQLAAINAGGSRTMRHSVCLTLCLTTPNELHLQLK